MNTDTGNIFAILNGSDALAPNEVELTAKQFAELIPMRSLEDRLGAYAQMKKPARAPQRNGTRSAPSIRHSAHPGRSESK